MHATLCLLVTVMFSLYGGGVTRTHKQKECLHWATIHLQDKRLKLTHTVVGHFALQRPEKKMLETGSIALHKEPNVPPQLQRHTELYK